MYQSADSASTSGHATATMTRDVVNRNVNRGENDLRNNQHNVVLICTCGGRGESNQLWINQ